MTSRLARCQVSGLARYVAGFQGSYWCNLHFKWPLADEHLGAFDCVISATTSLLTYSSKPSLRAAPSDLIAYSKKLCMHAAVWDVYLGLRVEEALVGTRHMDSAVNSA